MDEVPFRISEEIEKTPQQKPCAVVAGYPFGVADKLITIKQASSWRTPQHQLFHAFERIRCRLP